jgi:hypothetical protein
MVAEYGDVAQGASVLGASGFWRIRKSASVCISATIKTVIYGKRAIHGIKAKRSKA